MEVSVESLDGLQRRVTVVVPSARVEDMVSNELTKLASRVQIDGFRKGKVPLHIVKQRYSESVRLEAGQDILKETIDDALHQQKLSPVSTPKVEILELGKGKDFRYSVTFEVYPEFEIKELNKKAMVNIIKSSVKDEDVLEMIEKLREQNKTWKIVSRKAKNGDKLSIDFKGFVDDKPFERGESKGFSVELGSHQMIPGFEEALVGHVLNETFSIDVTFPKEYQQADLAGKPARFEIVIHQIEEPDLPETDEAFVRKFGIESGDLSLLKADIRAHMERELEKRLREINHDHCFTALAKENQVDLPNSLIDKEIENLKHELYHQVFGHQHRDDEKIPDFPREMFEERARKRVHIGLLVSEYVRKHRLVVEDERVEKMLDRLSAAYENPEDFKSQSRQNTKWMAEIEAIVLEQMIAEHICESASTTEKELAYEAAMSYRAPEEHQTKEA